MVEMEGRIFIYQKYVVFMSKCILRFDINYLFKDFVFFQNYDFIDLDLNQLYYAACLLHFFRDWVKKITRGVTILSILIALIIVSAIS